MSRIWRVILVGVLMLLSTTLMEVDLTESQGLQAYDRLHAQDEPRLLQSGCPTDDTYVTNDTILDMETCYVNDTNEDGVLIIVTSGITLDCNYANLIGDGTGIAILIRASDVTVQNCVIESYRIGVKIVGSTGSSVLYSDIHYSSSSAIWIDESSSFTMVSHNLITGTISEFYEGLPGCGIFIGGPHNVVSNNELYQNLWGISLIRFLVIGEDRSNNVIEWNDIDSSSLGIHLHGSGTRIANNSIVAGDAGLSVFMDSRDNTIVDNLIEGNGHGVHLEGLRNYFGRNSIVSNGGVGLSMEVASSNIIYNNIIESNGGVGIGIDMASKYNRISWNEIASNHDGIRLYGIYGGTASSFENAFHHNSIRENSHIQAEDKEPLMNFWNSSCSGNYWSDYGGVDLNGDGIGDSPYVIDNGGVDDAPSIDYLPLMSPGIDPCNSPGTLEISMSGLDLVDITVTWKKSPGEGQPQGVIKYRVMRANHIAGPYIMLSEVSASGSSEYSYTDFGMGHGQPDGLFYSVQAIDESGHIGISDLAVKYVRDLQPGMQLISIPLSLIDNRVQSVLQTVSYNDVWMFDAGDPTNPWRSYSESKPYDSCIALEMGAGVWVNVDQASVWTIVGTYPLSRSIPLRSGWNLVGYPSLLTRTVTEALAGVPYVAIETYDHVNEPFHLSRLSGSDYLEPGRGYWIQVSQDVVWNV